MAAESGGAAEPAHATDAATSKPTRIVATHEGFVPIRLVTLMLPSSHIQTTVVSTSFPPLDDGMMSCGHLFIVMAMARAAPERLARFGSR